MTEYIYKGFKISYNVESLELAGGGNLYKADGSVTYLLHKPKSFAPVKFHTEYESYSGAEHEIKKMLENYIDFELQSYYEMAKEKTR
ncbi:hypothetical protein [Legionella londiniensis]|uniref:Uncharacterized protein n=1 Tax=Legionella londiniensis TaxID=45068 RepID=A0A0W0VI65_9GAMM|nr:hypothetical protein [Legionella londiniensis]KTD19816.1 hypothetical protein Llon_1988 [Legionella londiniensis]STX92273.1 Uncharacterised protein [Legionella londiniensis]